MTTAVEEGWGHEMISPPGLPGWADDEVIPTVPKFAKTEPELKIGLSMEHVSRMIDLEEEDICIFNTHLHHTPSYFQVEGTPSIPWILEEMNFFSQSYPNFSYENIEAPVRYRLAGTLNCLRNNVLGAFVDTDYFELGVQVAATLVYLLYPKEILFLKVNYTESIRQKNLLWEQLVILGNKAVPIEDACKLIIECTRDTLQYSFVTETDVSDMLFDYRVGLRNGSFSLPYQFDPSSKPQKNPCPRPESFKQGLLFRSIFEVVEKMETPLELKADDLTRLLIKILKKEVDRKWLLNFALEKVVHTSAKNMLIRDKLFVGSGTECSHDRMSRAFDCLMHVLLDDVHGMMKSKIVDAVLPLRQLIQSNSNFRVSVEVTDLLYVAELRRLAEGNRFINRFHILWAFYELGYGLPPVIPGLPLIFFNLPCRDHPPYDIYLASIKVAEYFGDKVRLENFLFVVLHLYNIYRNLDGEQCKVMVKQEYLDFLTALRRFSSNSHDLEGPVFIRDFPRMLQYIGLEFNGS